jgi:alkylation response protein AidB-like acyl-CoA dehydrogenase
MDFSYSSKEEAFRREVRGWLAENMKELPRWWFDPDVPDPEPESEEYHQFSLWWHRKLYKAGFVGINWPKEYGGRGATLMEQVVFTEELAKHRAPGPSNSHGLGWCGPAILTFGTEEQKRRFIPKIISGEEIWCTLYSEPEAGSDMANVRTSAVEEGDYYVVNGQKVWTSGGHYADWAVILVRTDPSASKHRGLSYLLTDMRTPGITVRPLRNITGQHEFNETFLDNVRIPKHQILGEKNRGWYVAVGALEFERSGIAQSLLRENTVKDLLKLAKETRRNGQPLSNDPVIRQKLAQLFIDVNVQKYTSLRALTSQLRGQRPGPETLVSNLFGVELNQRMQDLAMQLEGPYGQLMRGSKYAIHHGEWQYSFLRSRANTIETGTSEIKRDIIAQRGLGLPRAAKG